MSSEKKHTSSTEKKSTAPADENLRIAEYLSSPINPDTDEIGQLSSALKSLTSAFESRYRELEKLSDLTAKLNSGLFLDNILDNVYRDFREIIPFNRLALSIMSDGGRKLRAYWAKSDQDVVEILPGYEASLEGSSLKKILETRRPRIINDLALYLEHNPDSESTRLIVAEGMRSSLTCPLVTNDIPIGFLFFSSVSTNTYGDAHVAVYQKIADQLSLIVDKGRLLSELIDRKAEIQKKNRALEQLNEKKNAFVGIAAHDLRGPISTVRNVVELLLESGFKLPREECLEFLDMAHRKCEDMLGLIDQLLNLTEIESGKLKLNIKDLNLQSFLPEVVDEHGRLAARKNSRIHLEQCPEITVPADRRRIRQVLDNILSNAVKYSPPNSDITVLVQESKEDLRIEVRDQGPGLTEEDQRKLFQDFSKLSARPTAGESSTGLGLAIAKRMVTEHKGKIGVVSSAGEGARFWFTLPKATI